MLSGDAITTLVQEAKRCKYSLIPANLSVDDVLLVWDGVAAFIVRQLVQPKGVNITGFGMFSLLSRSVQLAADRKVSMHRPVFVLSEKFSKTHRVTYTKYLAPGEIPVVQLNLAAISLDLGVERDTVDICLREIVAAFSRTVHSKRRAVLPFKDIGNLLIAEGKAKFKFSRDFMRLLDGRRGFLGGPPRPGTSDSFMSRSSLLSAPSGLASARGRCAIEERPPSVISNHGSSVLDLRPLEPLHEEGDYPVAPSTAPPSRITWNSDVLACDGGMELDRIKDMNRKIKTDLKPTEIKGIAEGVGDKEGGDPEKTAEVTIAADDTLAKCHSTSEMSCEHNCGQELCYVCHQRQRRNLPLSFTAERARAEEEQDTVLQQYQNFLDSAYYEREKRYQQRDRDLSKEVAEFNLDLAEKTKTDRLPDKEFYQSYLFARRPPAPRRFLGPEQYGRQLGEQVREREHRTETERRAVERSERRELAELGAEIAAAREARLARKQSAVRGYQAALETQLANPPFRFPAAVPDSDQAVFGRADLNPARVGEMRKRSKEVMGHQLRASEDHKRRAAAEKKESVQRECEMIVRGKTEVREESYRKFQLREAQRKELIRSWSAQHQLKLARETDELEHRKKDGMLLLAQCDRYKRCRQCQRCCDNKGTSNIWRESRFIPGCRLIV